MFDEATGLPRSGQASAGLMRGVNITRCVMFDNDYLTHRVNRNTPLNRRTGTHTFTCKYRGQFHYAGWGSSPTGRHGIDLSRLPGPVAFLL